MYTVDSTVETGKDPIVIWNDRKDLKGVHAMSPEELVESNDQQHDGWFDFRPFPKIYRFDFDLMNFLSFFCAFR